jgi:endonuclease YncB( thermonuclease family)
MYFVKTLVSFAILSAALCHTQTGQSQERQSASEATPWFSKVSGVITQVSSGPSFQLKTLVWASISVVSVRLFGVECRPPIDQYGKEALRLADRTSFGKSAVVNIISSQDISSVYGDIILTSGQSVTEELLKSGLCWIRLSADGVDPAWVKIQQTAREQRIGVWEVATTCDPSDWRRPSWYDELRKLIEPPDFATELIRRMRERCSEIGTHLQEIAARDDQKN